MGPPIKSFEIRKTTLIVEQKRVIGKFRWSSEFLVERSKSGKTLIVKDKRHWTISVSPLIISGYNGVFGRRAYPKTFRSICQMGIISDTTFSQNHHIRFHFFLRNLSCSGSPKSVRIPKPLYPISREEKLESDIMVFATLELFWI